MRGKLAERDSLDALRQPGGEAQQAQQARQKAGVGAQRGRRTCQTTTPAMMICAHGHAMRCPWCWHAQGERGVRTTTSLLEGHMDCQQAPGEKPGS